MHKSMQVYILVLIKVSLITCASTLLDSDDRIEYEQVEAPTSQSSENTEMYLMEKNTRDQTRALTVFETQKASSTADNTSKIELSDLHTAYRLPLYRLSDAQLQLLIRRYETNKNNEQELSRSEMISRLKELITKDDKMLRPRLLTNINVMDLNDLAIRQPVVSPDEIERTTVGTIQTSFTLEPGRDNTHKAFLINNDDENLETAEQVATTPEETPTATYGATALETSTTQSSTALTPEHLHKDIPIDTQPKMAEKDKEEEEELMRQKNNKLHSEYIASLSSDLQKLKAKYDLMKIEFLRALRRINERNVIRANKLNQAAAPTFVVSPKDASEPDEEGKSGFLLADKQSIPRVIVDSIGDTQQSSKESTNTATQKSLGAETIEAELLSNKQIVKQAPKAKEEVASSIAITDASGSSLTIQQANSVLKPDERSGEEPIKTPGTATIFNRGGVKLSHENTNIQPTVRPILDSDRMLEITTLKPKVLEKLVDSSELTVHSGGVYKQISTVDLDKLDDESPRFSSSLELSETIEATQQPASLEISTQEPINMMEVIEKLESELMSPMSWKKGYEIQTQKETEKKKSQTLVEQPNIQSELKKIDELITTADLIDHLQKEAKDAGRTPPCRTVSCDFEEGSLCLWKSSVYRPLSQKLVNSNHRRNSYTIRSWQIRDGIFLNLNQSIDKSNIFSSMNGRFLGAYLRPQQRAVLFAELPPSFQTKNQAAAIINFKVWEATRGLQLKACCDNLTYCVYQTDIGLKRGTRRWLDKEAICPIGTRKILFECANHGNYQGACGLDSITLLNETCPTIPQTKTYLVDGGEQR